MQAFISFRNRALISVLLLISLGVVSRAETGPDFSVPFATSETDTLSIDFYMPADSAETHYCIIFSYGGGFVDNNRKDSSTIRFCRRLAEDGYVAVATDYRLGLKGVKMNGVLSMVKPLRAAVGMAAEDVLKVTALVLDNASEWKIRPDGIILCGASAGAITSLQCDYELCNGTASAAILPEDFEYAGIVSFAGAVFSEKGTCKYPKHNPAPTLLLHGTADRLVTYDKIAFFDIRFSGSNDLAKQFAANHWPYEIIRYQDEGHGVAGRTLESYDEMVWFLDNMVVAGRNLEIDKTVFDHDHVRCSWDTVKPEALY